MSERKKIQLLTSDEIMELGKEFMFEYEPISSVCKLGKTSVYWGCVNYIDGVMQGPYGPKFDKDWFTEEDYKRTIASRIPVKFVHEIFVFDLTETNPPCCSGYIHDKNHAHFDERVWYRGHTPLTNEEWYEKHHLNLIENKYGDLATGIMNICRKYKKVEI